MQILDIVRSKTSDQQYVLLGSTTRNQGKVSLMLLCLNPHPPNQRECQIVFHTNPDDIEVLTKTSELLESARSVVSDISKSSEGSELVIKVASGVDVYKLSKESF